MTIRGIESYRSALQISEQTKNRIRNGVDGQPARAAGQESVEISRDGMERYKESLVKSATNGLNHNDNGTGVMMTDFHTLFGSRMPSIYGEKNENGEYVLHYFSAEETAANMKKVYGESGISAEQKKGKVGINAAKLARMLAAAKTRAQVQTVIAQIQSDLKECDVGKEQGLDVDEASVEAAKSVLQDAQSRMGQAENREATPEEEMASALASLM